MYEFSRGTVIVDIMPVLNSFDTPSSFTHEKFIEIFVEHLPNELGTAELIADFYRHFSKARSKKVREHQVKYK